MMGNATTDSLNDYEKKLDSIINIFYTIKCESEESSINDSKTE
jgi:hypothetical protein